MSQIKVSLACRSPLQLERMEQKMREKFDVRGGEKGPSRNGKHRRFLTVHLPPDPPPPPSEEQ